jgi:hypothetical protein
MVKPRGCCCRDGVSPGRCDIPQDGPLAFNLSRERHWFTPPMCATIAAVVRDGG